MQWSIVDYWRVPKRSYDAMRLAFSPQYSFTLLEPDQYPVGQPIELPIYIVNDAQRSVPAQLNARLISTAGGQLARVERELTLPPDCMALEIDRLRLTPDRPGTYRLLLALRGEGDLLLEQEYEIVVAEPG